MRTIGLIIEKDKLTEEKIEQQNKAPKNKSPKAKKPPKVTNEDLPTETTEETDDPEATKEAENGTD